MKRIFAVLFLLVAASLSFWKLGCPSGRENPPASVLFSRGLVPVTTGWEMEPERLSASYCAKCHKEAHLQWKEGTHARAWMDPAFVEAFKLEPREWCVHCHAPLASQLKEQQKKAHPSQIADLTPQESESPALLSEGINCAVCHVREGKILSTTFSGHAPHESTKTPYLETSEFCAECHQFNFPTFRGEEVHYTTEPMQNTYSEWMTSSYDRTCQTCHYEDHRLLGPHSHSWLREHFSEFVTEISPRLVSVRFDVDSFRAHNLPSGDLFKSLVLQAAQDVDFQKVFFQKKWARVYGEGLLKGGTLWNRSLVANTALRPQETRVSLTFDLPPNGPVYLRLVYSIHDEELGGRSNLPQDERQVVIWRQKVR